PAIEAVVRHALEKEVSARTDSIDTFIKELHAAMHSTPLVTAPLRETVVMDPNRTMTSAVTTLNPPPAAPPTGSTTQAPKSSDTHFAVSFELRDEPISGTHPEKKGLKDPETPPGRRAPPTVVDEAPNIPFPPPAHPPPQPPVQAPAQPAPPVRPAQPLER